MKYPAAFVFPARQIALGLGYFGAVHGIILSELHKFVVSQHGPDTWRYVSQRAGLSEETFTPLEIYDYLQQAIPKPQLIQALFWIAVHPMDGDDSAIEQLPALGMNYPPSDVDETRNRAAFYAVKLLGRLTGKVMPR